MKKIAEDLKRLFSQKRHTDGQQAHENVLTVANY